MNGLGRVRLGLAATLAAALVGAGALLLVSQAAAVSGTLTVGSATLAPGGQATVDIRANVPTPGLGAWTLDLTYDPAKVSIVSCAPAPSHSECNTHYGANTIRLVGATGPGLMGDVSLATVTFHSLAASGSACSAAIPLTVTATLFDDATTGGPQPVTVTVTNGALLCPAAPTAVAPTATPLPRLVVTGAGSGAAGSSSGWLIALAGVGVAVLAGYGAVRLRTKQT
jgi:hypothetical protein